jgi:hypothetical protein
LGPKRDPGGLCTPGRSRAEPSLDEPSLDEPGETDPADTYWTLTGTYPNDKARTWIDDMTRQYGAELVSRTLAEEHVSNSTVTTLLGRTKTALTRQARAAERAELDAEKERNAEKRKPVVLRRLEEDVSDEEAERQAREWRESMHREATA